MVTLIRIEVSGGTVPVVLATAIVRTVHMTVARGIAPVHRIPIMRGDRSGMKAGQDHRKEAEKGDKRTHAVLISVGHAQCIVRVSATAEGVITLRSESGHDDIPG